MDLNSWWSSKELIEQGFWVIAVPSSVFFMIMLVLTFFGGDVEAGEMEFDADAGDIDDVGDDGGIGFQFFTLKNLIAFFAVFSWTGIACVQQGIGTLMTLIISLLAGMVIMTIMAALFYFISKLAETGTMNMKMAIGQVGESYLPIMANRSGMGKVQVNVQGTLRTLDAMTDDGEQIPSGKAVKVVGIYNDQILLVTNKTN